MDGGFGDNGNLLCAPIISTVLLVDFLLMLPRHDESVWQTGIMDGDQISTRFRIKLILHADEQDIYFSVWIFRLPDGFGKETRYGLELL